LGHLFANAALLVFHGCKVLHHLSEREREGAKITAEEYKIYNK
jgi:hypothetical protein